MKRGDLLFALAVAAAVLAVTAALLAYIQRGGQGAAVQAAPVYSARAALPGTA